MIPGSADAIPQFSPVLLNAFLCFFCFFFNFALRLLFFVFCFCRWLIWGDG